MSGGKNKITISREMKEGKEEEGRSERGKMAESGKERIK